MLNRHLSVLTLLASLGVAPSLAAQLQWQQLSTPQSPAPRYGHSGTRWGIVFGGRDQTQAFADTWVFEHGMASGTPNWRMLPTATAPSPRYGHAVDTGVDDVLMFGGADVTGVQNNETWLFHTNWATTPPGGTVTSSWQPLQPAHAPSARQGHALAIDWWTTSYTRAALFGGRVGNAVNGETWLYDNGDWQQVVTPIAPPAREGHRLVPTADGWLLFGGTDGTTVFDDVWRFDGTVWHQLANAPFAATGASATFLEFERGRHLFVGGRDAAGQLRTELFERSPSSGTWFQQPTVGALPARENAIAVNFLYHAPTFDLVEAAFVFGGRDGQGQVLGDTWRLVPTNQVGWWAGGAGCGPGQWSNNGPELFLPFLILGNSGRVSVFTHTESVLVVLGLQLDTAPLPNPCEVTVDPALLLVGISSVGTSYADFQLSIPFFEPLRGHTLSMQSLVFEPASPTGIALSALHVLRLGD